MDTFALINKYHVQMLAYFIGEAAPPRPTATARCSITR